jgi:hypothetical protein
MVEKRSSHNLVLVGRQLTSPINLAYVTAPLLYAAEDWGITHWQPLPSSFPPPSLLPSPFRSSISYLVDITIRS